MRPRRASIVYCPTCGHSNYGGDLLAEGSDGCQALIASITVDEWRAIAKVHPLRLTDAGRAILKEG